MRFASLFMAAASALALPALANDAAQLAQKNNCTACHAADKKLVGPSWNEIAKKYAADSNAEAALAAKVKKGGAGVWGAIPMPPNSTARDEDIKVLVRFVLGHK